MEICSLFLRDYPQVFVSALRVEDPDEMIKSIELSTSKERMEDRLIKIGSPAVFQRVDVQFGLDLSVQTPTFESSQFEDIVPEQNSQDPNSDEETEAMEEELPQPEKVDILQTIRAALLDKGITDLEVVDHILKKYWHASTDPNTMVSTERIVNPEKVTQKIVDAINAGKLGPENIDGRSDLIKMISDIRIITYDEFLRLTNAPTTRVPQETDAIRNQAEMLAKRCH